MKRHVYIYDTLLMFILLACMIFLLIFNFRESRSLIFEQILNFGHVPLFGSAALFTLWIVNRRRWPVYEKRTYILTFTFAVIFGISSEFLQALTSYRDFEIFDMLRDSVGALCFLLLAYPYQSSSHNLWKNLKALSVLTIILSAIPIYLAMIQSWQMKHDFPLIDSFEHIWEKGRWAPQEATFTLSTSHATHGLHSLKTNLDPGIYPGISLDQHYGDWSGYDVFSFDVFLEGNKPLVIMVRINDDKHDQTYKDRFNKCFILYPRVNHIVIDLLEVLKAPHSRVMDMGNITDIVIFSANLKESKTLFFDNFRLEIFGKPSS